MSVPVYIALLHYPIRNRRGQIVTTAVTNMDIHDISRSARTYGVRRFFIVTPIEVQHEMVGRILAHWKSEQSLRYHPDRVEALDKVRLVHTFEEVKAEIVSDTQESPEVVLTDAKALPGALSFVDYRRELEERGGAKPTCLVFGTGWGVSEAFYPEVHRVLAPVCGPEGQEGYNHLSVRAAVGIILDRLFGQ